MEATVASLRDVLVDESGDRYHHDKNDQGNENASG
jgi:hypothetical protein